MQETQEVSVPSLAQEDPLEEEVATHSSIVAIFLCPAPPSTLVLVDSLSLTMMGILRKEGGSYQWTWEMGPLGHERLHFFLPEIAKQFYGRWQGFQVFLPCWVSGGQRRSEYWRRLAVCWSGARLPALWSSVLPSLPPCPLRGSP